MTSPAPNGSSGRGLPARPAEPDPSGRHPKTKKTPKRQKTKKPQTSRGRRRTVAIIVVAIALAAVLAITLGIVIALQPATAGAPGRGTIVVASDLTQSTDAASAAPDGSPAQEAAQYLSEQPTAFWLTPEADPVDVIPARIAHLANEARGQSARLAIVVYGLPGRDCGNFSSGGIAEDAYVEWTAAIGAALQEAEDVDPIVILEPDSLALAPECGNEAERTRQLRAAVDGLASEHTWIYIDGGHSNWLPVAEMAYLIDRVAQGGGIRGFTTNVSNYNATGDEVDYAHDLAKRLGGGLHALIDTGRNGAGSNGEWCNPPGRLVGEPGGTIGDDVVDTNLWIKPPGESDGACNGGPAAGEWWTDSAVELTRDALGR